MSKKLLDKFYDYTIQDNSGFKIAIGDLVVSVACHNYLDAYDEMNRNGIAGSDISIEKMPSDLMAFTFMETILKLLYLIRKQENMLLMNLLT